MSGTSGTPSRGPLVAALLLAALPEIGLLLAFGGLGALANIGLVPKTGPVAATYFSAAWLLIFAAGFLLMRRVDGAGKSLRPGSPWMLNAATVVGFAAVLATTFYLETQLELFSWMALAYAVTLLALYPRRHAGESPHSNGQASGGA